MNIILDTYGGMEIKLCNYLNPNRGYQPIVDKMWIYCVEIMEKGLRTLEENRDCRPLYYLGESL
jgi:hypothetical protein